MIKSIQTETLSLRLNNVKGGKENKNRKNCYVACTDDYIGIFPDNNDRNTAFNASDTTREGQSTSFIGALFTATSATCVTGLVTYDTFLHWTYFGQVVILIMIQIGGLGFITLGVYGMMLLRKKIGLKSRELIHDSLNSMHVGGGVRLVKFILSGTFIFEFTGALILSMRFIPEYGLLKGVYFGIFHAVSAFCNAGFDLMGEQGAYSSFCNYVGDITINVVIMLLIIIGGIGFSVWSDVYKNKLHVKKYMLHTKIVLITTLVLLVGGTVFFWISESRGIFADMGFKDKLLASAFSSVTPRTAGFNTVDTAALSDAGKAVTMLLMFIGGSPGSTAGGIKTTTVAAIVFFIMAYIKKEKGCNVFRRRIDDDLIKKASTVFFVNASLAIAAILVITLNQNISLVDASFEVFSALGTVGMTTGITRDLTVLSKLVIVFLMFCGRVGSLSFAVSFLDRKRVPDMRYPTEDVIIG